MRHLLIALALAAALLVAAFLAPGPGAPLVAVLGTTFPIGLAALGATRRGRPSRAVAALMAVLALLLAGTAGALLATRHGTSPAIGAVIFLAGLWLLPLPLATLGYAATFRDHGISREDLERLRRMRRRDDDGDAPP